MFKPTRIVQALPVFQRALDGRVKNWERLAEAGEAFDLHREMLHLVLECSSEALFGFRLGGEIPKISAALVSGGSESWCESPTP